MKYINVMNYAVSFSHEPQIFHVMTSDRNICYEHALSIQRDCFWRACLLEDNSRQYSRQVFYV